MTETLIARLLKHAERNTDGCWTCNLAKTGIGYAKITVEGRTVRAHRLAYELFVGEIPEGMSVLHSCDNPACINPEHLHVGTQHDNMKERSLRGRAPTGSRNSNTKLTNEQAIEIKVRLANGEPERRIASAFGVAKNAISNIRHGRSWRGTEAK